VTTASWCFHRYEKPGAAKKTLGKPGKMRLGPANRMNEAGSALKRFGFLGNSCLLAQTTPKLRAGIVRQVM
jgi:hypothetical protein